MTKPDATPTAPLQAPDVMAAACPARQILNHVTSRWGVLVLISLRGGSVLRFSELRRKIGGVTERMLAQTLQTLEGDGFVLRHAYAVVPPRVEYRLTPMGEDIAVRIEGIGKWIEDNLEHIVKAQQTRGG